MEIQDLFKAFLCMLPYIIFAAIGAYLMYPYEKMVFPEDDGKAFLHSILFNWFGYVMHLLDN